jgi:predicted O-methyltransferase YrrM
VKENGGGVVDHNLWADDKSHRPPGPHSSLGSDPVVLFNVEEAVETLRQTDGPFDIIFNDIDKEGYPDSLPIIKEKLRHGGLLIIDNMIWHGQILDPTDHEKSTEAIRRFTRDITTDLDWIVSLIPARDGMIVAYKK